LTALVALATSVTAASGAEVGWKPTHAEVRVVCPLTVGGSFEVRTTTLTGTLSPSAPGSPLLVGRLEVDLRTLDSGIDLRNDHMRNKYLEVGRGAGFDHAVLTQVTLAKGDALAFEGKGGFTARLSLHGIERPVAGEVDVRGSGTNRKVSVTMPVTVSDFGVDKPRYLGIGVKDQVQVKVTFSTEPSPSGIE
jgi:polyisoprenoid-binding protein YceI